MKRLLVAVMSAIVMVGLSVGTAEAKRFGGGSSFGSKQSHSQPQKMDSAPQSASQAAPSPANSAAAAPAAAAPRPGMGGKLGGMLGGLLVGGLIGSLLFGGAFENINFMDILIFAGIALAIFMIFRSLASRRAPSYAASAPYASPASADMNAPQTAYQRESMSMPASSSSFARPSLVLPAGFDSKDFLEGAKRAYGVLQKAWDDGDLAELRGLTTDKVFGEVQDQYRARSGENRTEISDVRAELLDVKEIDGNLEASVLFDSMIAEYDANSPLMVNSTRVREVWHFVRAKSSLRPTWLLDGIQQVTE